MTLSPSGIGIRQWAVGVALGMVCGGLPLVSAQIQGPAVDPFDQGLSYLVWAGGAFLAASGLAYRQPNRRILWAVAVQLGFNSAMVLEVVIDFHSGRVSHNLWPLTLAAALLIGAPPAFLGAYFGSRLKTS